MNDDNTNNLIRQLIRQVSRNSHQQRQLGVRINRFGRRVNRLGRRVNRLGRQVVNNDNSIFSLLEPVCIRWPFAFIIDFKGARFVDVIGSYLISPCGARTSLIECVQKFTDNRHWIDADLDLLIFAFAFSETIETGFCNELNFSVASLQVVVTPDNDKNCLQTL
uniref:Uncharacterized protein n=1 Tax=Meloidogyne hapla TaxID=6305 RepID=A0A1I8B1N1_MELHA